MAPLFKGSDKTVCDISKWMLFLRPFTLVLFSSQCSK